MDWEFCIMSGWKKLTAAPAASGGLDVDEVFQTFTYTGNSSSSKTINNGIDLSTEGGMVWSKNRISAENWICCDTERGAGKILQPNRTDTEFTNTNIISSFTTSGYTVGTDIRVNSSIVQDHCSFTFREHPDFFQIKTFSTTYNTDPSYLTHNLECDLGMAIFKSLDNASQSNNWVVWHKDLAALSANNYIRLNDTVGYIQDNANPIGYNSSTKTFTFNYPMSEAGDRLISGNQETTNWVGYFFGHHNNNGTFGPSGDQDIIKTGIYTGNGSSTGNGPEINLGWEPQFVMIKRINQNTSDAWLIYDNTRVADANIDRLPILRPSGNNTEYYGDVGIMFTGRGFQPKSGQSGINTNGNQYIYMAIRRGPLSPPSSGTDVFDVDNYSSGKIDLGWKPDMLLFHTLTNNQPYNGRLFFRKMGNTYNLVTNVDSAANYSSGQVSWDNKTPNNSTSPEFHNDFSGGQHYFWKQAPEFFSQQIYRGTGTGSQYVYHGLGTTPEMVWIKNLTNASGQDWVVWHKDLTSGYRIDLQNDDPETTASGYLSTSSFNDERFLVSSQLDNNSYVYGVMCWASVSGVSKVGSYTGNGSSVNVTVGFTPRFVLVKRIDSSSYWLVWDTDRGIVSGNDPFWTIDAAGAPYTTYDIIDPYTNGFTINSVDFQGYDYSASGGSFLYYAVA